MNRRRRRIVFVALISVIIAAFSYFQNTQQQDLPGQNFKNTTDSVPADAKLAIDALAQIEVKGRAPKTGYDRDLFGEGWAQIGNCDVRNIILKRDLTDITLDPKTECLVLSGTLVDPYTNKTIHFTRGAESSQKVQIDHVVALSDAWQKGAQQLNEQKRERFANDPLNLLAVDGPTNQKKGDGDAASWLPPNKSYRCAYVARQTAVKAKYDLWVTRAEHDAIERVLLSCPNQVLPVQN